MRCGSADVEISDLCLQDSWVPVGQLGGVGCPGKGAPVAGCSLSWTETSPFTVCNWRNVWCCDAVYRWALELICTLQSTLCVEGSAPDYLVFQGDDIVGPRPTSSCTVVGWGEWGCLLSQSFAAPSMTTHLGVLLLLLGWVQGCCKDVLPYFLVKILWILLLHYCLHITVLDLYELYIF